MEKKVGTNLLAFLRASLKAKLIMQKYILM